MKTRKILIALNSGGTSFKTFKMALLITQKYGAYLMGIITQNVRGFLFNVLNCLAERMRGYFDDITVLGQYKNLIVDDERILHPDQMAYDSGHPIIVAPHDCTQNWIHRLDNSSISSG